MLFRSPTALLLFLSQVPPLSCGNQDWPHPGPALWRFHCVCEEGPRGRRGVLSSGPPAQALSSLPPDPIPLLFPGTPQPPPPPAPLPPHPASSTSLHTAHCSLLHQHAGPGTLSLSLPGTLPPMDPPAMPGPQRPLQLQPRDPQCGTQGSKGCSVSRSDSA